VARWTSVILDSLTGAQETRVTPRPSVEIDPIAIIGLGRIGLALAGHYLERGFRVIGCDTDVVRREGIADGEIARGEPGLETALRRGIEELRFTATGDAGGAARAARTSLVIVPVTADSGGQIDAGPLEDVAKRVVGSAPAGSLVVVETTVPVGTTRRLFGAARSAVAYSPERVSVGSVFRDLRAYPKIVGGRDEDSLALASSFYARTLDGAVVMPVGSLETAEFVKLIETTYRFVNIGLANEFALAAERHGVDVTRAIEAANSQPYSHIHSPGVGVGGHCIPVYPFFLEAGASATAIVRASRAVNVGMPQVIVDKVRSALGTLSGRRVLLLGIAFRPGTKESANSPAFTVHRLITDAGGIVAAYDPLYGEDETRAAGLIPADLGARYDAVVLVTAHPEFLDLGIVARSAPVVVVDGRNAWPRGDIERLGIRYLGVGR